MRLLGDGMSANTSDKKAKLANLGRVLLVEDDTILALALEDALLRGGAKQVVICQTMKATLAELDKSSKFDAVVLDVHLGDRDDGWALAELVSLLGPRKPRIAFSTGSPSEIPADIANMGPVFEKPYDPEQLVDVLTRGAKKGLIARLLR